MFEVPFPLYSEFAVKGAIGEFDGVGKLLVVGAAVPGEIVVGCEEEVYACAVRERIRRLML